MCQLHPYRSRLCGACLGCLRLSAVNCWLPQVALGTAPNCISRQYSASAGDKFGWQNGPSSRCMPVTWLFNTFTYQFPDSTYKDGWKDSMCYKSSCTADGQLQLSILGNNVSCPSGQTVDLAKALPNQFSKGSIGSCPDNKAMCDSLRCGDSCTIGGTCANGKCYCNLEFFGPDCAKRLMADGNYTNYVPVADDGQPANQAFDNGYLMVSRAGRQHGRDGNGRDGLIRVSARVWLSEPGCRGCVC